MPPNDFGDQIGSQRNGKTSWFQPFTSKSVNYSPVVNRPLTVIDFLHLQSWTKHIIRIEAIKCFPCYIKINLLNPDGSESVNENLVIRINIPGLALQVVSHCSDDFILNSKTIVFLLIDLCCVLIGRPVLLIKNIFQSKVWTQVSRPVGSLSGGASFNLVSYLMYTFIFVITNINWLWLLLFMKKKTKKYFLRHRQEQYGDDWRVSYCLLLMWWIV